MGQHDSQRKVSTVFARPVFQMIGVIAVAFALSACSALTGSSRPDLAESRAAEASRAGAADAVRLETELARVKAENARLKFRVKELERVSAAEASETALRDGEPVVLAGAAPVSAEPRLTVPSPVSATRTAIVANAEEAPLSSDTVPVQRAPRLVQPTFAATVTSYENEAPPADDELEMASVLYGVHLASYRVIASARTGWRQLQRENPDELGLLEPRIKSVTLPGKGDFLRLIGGGFASEEKAHDLCAQLKQNGVFCSVAAFDGEVLTFNGEG